MLMQGLSLPSPSPSSSTPLPPPCQRPTTAPPPPSEPHTYEEIEDTTGMARVKGSTATFSPVITTTATTATTNADPSIIAKTVVKSVSRTTDWRQRKGGQTKRKEYSCRVCGNPMTAGKCKSQNW